MIASLRELNKGFFQQFYGENLDRNYVPVILEDLSVLQVSLYYFKKSSFNYTETQEENYPIVSIESFTPTQRVNYNNYTQKRFAGLRDTDGDSIKDTITEFPMPIWLECRFEVSVAAMNEKHFTYICDWFLQTFDLSNQAFFEYNKQPVAGQDRPIADYVPYKMEMTESPRTDGIYEMVFTFTLYPRLDIKATKDHTVFTELEVQLNNAPFDIEQFLLTTAPLGISTIEENAN